MVQMGQDLTRGLERGARSLMRHSVLGWSNTICKASGSAARFVAYLSMDDFFASEISKLPDERDDPRQIGLMPGLVVGIGSLARVPSLAWQRAWNYPSLAPWVLFPVPGPRVGSDNHHVTIVHRFGAAVPALLHGSVQAILGLLAKPLAGALDTITQTSFSFHYAALAYLGTDGKDVSALRQRWQRVRPPRPLSPDKVASVRAFVSMRKSSLQIVCSCSAEDMQKYKP